MRIGSSLSLPIGLKSETILIRGISNSINYGLNRVRFIAPVPAGSRIRARFRLARLQQMPDGAYQLTWSAVAELEGSDKPACVAETMSRLYS